MRDRARSFIAACSVGTLLLLSFPLAAQAHVLKSDNGINAVLHVPPYDDPMSGQPTQLQFQFGTASGSFQIGDYAVSVALLEHGKDILDKPVTAPYFGANAEGDATVQFPRADVYYVVLKGMPKHSEVPAFTMTYLLRVTGASPNVKAGVGGSEILLIGSALIIILMMVATRQIVTGKRYAKPKPVGKKVKRRE